MKFINLYTVSLTFWICLTCIVIVSGIDHPIQNEYLLVASYNSFFDVLNQLSVIDYNTDLFEWCCDCINFLARKFGYTYQEMNIILFVIFLPGMLLNLIIITIIQLIQLNSK